MPRLLRLTLVVPGLVAVVYGTSTLTGGWLGTPPWWHQEAYAAEVTVLGGTHRLALEQERPGREGISSAVVAVGLGLLAFGAWKVWVGQRDSTVTRT